jgi:hypothetical protein
LFGSVVIAVGAMGRVWKELAMPKCRNQGTAGLNLELVVRLLHASDLRVGIQTYEEGIHVWISDRLHRVREERLFKRSGATSAWRDDSAALWLHTAALRLFPDRPYARDFRAAMLEVGSDEAIAEPPERLASSDRATTQPPGPSKCYRLKGHKVGNRSSFAPT